MTRAIACRRTSATWAGTTARTLLASTVLGVLAGTALHRRKGIDVLIDALARLSARTTGEAPTPLTWIAGKGPESKALGAQVAAAGLQDDVRFLGRRDDTADLLAACDIAVLPSRREGLGIAALEAMATGRPIVAAQVGGLADAVVHEGTGLLVPPDDPDALADALAALVADPERRRRLGEGGPRHVAEKYSPEAMVAAYVQVYDELGVAQPNG